MRMRGRGFTSGPTTRMGPAGRSAARISASGQWGAGEETGAEKTGRPPGLEEVHLGARGPRSRTTRAASGRSAVAERPLDLGPDGQEAPARLGQGPFLHVGLVAQGVDEGLHLEERGRGRPGRRWRGAGRVAAQPR